MNSRRKFAGKRSRLEPESSTGSTGSGLSPSGSMPSLFDHARKEASGSGYSPMGSSVNSPIVSLSFPLRPHHIDVNQPSYHPTPTQPHRHRSSAGSSGSNLPLGDSTRQQSLPRIAPLDTSVTPRPGPIDTKAVSQHPRRTTNSPASFLRKDTSKSSVSSTFSNTSQATQMTPVTPTEDLRLPRKLPPMIAGQLYESGPHSHPVYPSSALNPKTGGLGFTPSASGQSLGQPARSHSHCPYRLAHERDSDFVSGSRYSFTDGPPNPEVDRSRPHSNPQDHPMGDATFPAPPSGRRSASIGQNQHMKMRQEGRQVEDQRADADNRRRMDPLSVLVLAGTMAAQESSPEAERK